MLDRVENKELPKVKLVLEVTLAKMWSSLMLANLVGMQLLSLEFLKAGVIRERSH